MPAQIIYGKIIDSACVHWSTKACETGGYCQLFDNGHLRIFLHLITMGFSVGCIIAAAVAYWFARNFVFHLNQEKKTEEISLE